MLQVGSLTCISIILWRYSTYNVNDVNRLILKKYTPSLKNDAFKSIWDIWSLTISML